MNHFRKISAALLSGFVVFSAGCAADGTLAINKEEIGTLIGGATGGLLGSKIGGGSGRTVATIAGTIAGGYLGKVIGAKLDQRDREALAAQTDQVLRNAKDGQSTTWKSDHSGSSATITPGKTTTKSQDVAMKRTPQVQAVPKMKLLNETYRAKTDANVRVAPTADADKAGGLQAGTTFTAVGRVDNGWIMVGRQGVSIGYVAGSLVEPAAAARTAAASAQTSIDLDAMDAAQARSQGFDLDAIPVEGQVAVQTTCRTLKYSVKTDGATEEHNVNACQTPDGAWDLG